MSQHFSHTGNGTQQPYVDRALSRRSAVKAMFAAAGAAVLFGMPRLAGAAEATKETTEALSKAQDELDAAQAQLDSISAQFTELSQQLDATMGEIETVQEQIDDTQAEIDQKQIELEGKQEMLSDRVATSYKSGGNTAISLLLSSTSFDELISNVYYIDKVNESDQQAIEDIHTIQAELTRKKADLEEHQAELEELKASQIEQLDAMKAKKDEVQTLLDGLSDDVKELMEKRDAEILEAARQEELARKAAEEAAAAAAAEAESAAQSGGDSSGGGTTSIPGSGQVSAGAGAQQRIVDSAYSTPSPGAGLCAWWVSDVFTNAGFGTVWGNADDMYAAYCTSSNKANLKVGMIIAVPSHPHTSAGAIYGHVGIYVGNNTVRDNIGYIRDIDVDEWIAFYGPTTTPRWGWALGINLEG